MNQVLVCIGWLLFGGAGALQAALLVKVGGLKTTGGKTLIPLELKNTFDQQVESVRATLFLLGDQGKLAGQTPRRIVGGTIG